MLCGWGRLSIESVKEAGQHIRARLARHANERGNFIGLGDIVVVHEQDVFPTSSTDGPIAGRTRKTVFGLAQ